MMFIWIAFIFIATTNNFYQEFKTIFHIIECQLCEKSCSFKSCLMQSHGTSQNINRFLNITHSSIFVFIKVSLICWCCCCCWKKMIIIVWMVINTIKYALCSSKKWRLNCHYKREMPKQFSFQCCTLIVLLHFDDCISFYCYV